MNINWFPGHMAKTKRLILENLKLVDVVIELLDARIPYSSKNPDIDTFARGKKRIIVLNKSDLSDERINKEWKEWYNNNGYTCIFIDSIKGTGFKEVNKAINDLMQERIDREKQKGLLSHTIRTMVVGIPNVGKSSFINRFAGKSATVTGDRPGVTRNKQWVRLTKGLELLDTPGILWPKFEDRNVGYRLAFTGAIKDDILDIGEVAIAFLERVSSIYPGALVTRYKIEKDTGMTGLELLEAIGKKRGCIISGGNIDYMRASIIVLDEFRGGTLGRISLETPSQILLEKVIKQEGEKEDFLDDDFEVSDNE